MPELVKPKLQWFFVHERSNGPTSAEYRLIDLNAYGDIDDYIEETRDRANECGAWDHNYRGIEITPIHPEDVPAADKDTIMSEHRAYFEAMQRDWEKVNRFAEMSISAYEEMCK